MLDGHQNGMSGDVLACPQLPVIPSQDETHEEPESPVEIKPDRQDSIGSGMTNSGSSPASFEEAAGTRKVAVSVHDDRTLLPSYSLKSTNESFIEVLQGKQDTRTSELHSGMSKSTSGDNQASLCVSTSVSGADPTAAILGASTSSLTSITSSTAYRQPLARYRRFAPGYIENDLSTPYNHYRCLSPNEYHGIWKFENFYTSPLLLGPRSLKIIPLKSNLIA